MCATAVHPEDRIEIFCVPAQAARKVAESLGPDFVEYDASTNTLMMPALLNDVSWEQYELLLEKLPDHRMRHTYDRGTLEMMSPSQRHESIKRMIGRLIEMLTLELDIPIKSVGSTTQRRTAIRRGLEPDESYYIANEPSMRGKFDYDPDHDPPPDLVVEVDVRRPAIKRMAVYAALGVPEIWRHDGKSKLSFHQLVAGKYKPVEQSAAFPFLSPDDISRFIDQMYELDENSLVRAFLTRALAKHAKRSHASKKKKGS